MISVITPTNRIGGMDLLVESLKAQTYQDFELIIVDSIDNWRFGCTRIMPLNMRRIRPRSNPFPRVAYCETMNTGIANARGETCVFLCDYSWLHPDCLATHAECQARNPGPTHLDYNYSALPAAKATAPYYRQLNGPDSPEYLGELNSTTERYVRDLKAGRLDPFMWSIFEETPTEKSVRALPIEHKHRPCATREPDDWNWCSFKNESFPTELLLEMNGLDEAMDVSHCYQDVEFTQRLKKLGVRWHNGPPETGMVTVVNPRKILNVKQLKKPISWAKHYTDTKDYSLPVNPGFSLRSWRAEVLGT